MICLCPFSSASPPVNRPHRLGHSSPYQHPQPPQTLRDTSPKYRWAFHTLQARLTEVSPIIERLRHTTGGLAFHVGAPPDPRMNHTPRALGSSSILHCPPEAWGPCPKTPQPSYPEQGWGGQSSCNTLPPTGRRESTDHHLQEILRDTAGHTGAQVPDRTPLYKFNTLRSS
jgi:hypothetical protein